MRLITLKEIRKIHPEVFEISLQLLSNSNFTFTPGQFIDLAVPNLIGDPRGNHREFTIFSTPKELPIIKIAFRQTDSIFKNYLIANKGSQIELAGPYGDFVLPQSANQPIHLIAGGIGITPFMSMLANQPKLPLKLWWSNKETISPWLRRLEQFKQDLPNFDFDLQKGKFDWADVRRQADLKKDQFYISGPIGLVVDMKKSLLEAGVTTKQIFTDEFTGY